MLRMKYAAICVSLALTGALVAGQSKNKTPQPGDRLIHSLDGKDLYGAYCASCHGISGRGDGPIANELKRKPANLTALAASHGGIFPKDDVRQFIAGDKVVASHGSREMPFGGRSSAKSRWTPTTGKCGSKIW